MKIKKGKAKFRPIIITLEDEEELKFFYVLMRMANKWYQENQNFKKEFGNWFFNSFKDEQILDENIFYEFNSSIILFLAKVLGVKV